MYSCAKTLFLKTGLLVAVVAMIANIFLHIPALPVMYSMYEMNRQGVKIRGRLRNYTGISLIQDGKTFRREDQPGGILKLNV